MRYGLLGTLQVCGDAGTVLSLTSARERVLLAALALRANEVVSVSRLIDALWGEDPPATAANALQVHVSKLRKKLVGAGAGPETITSVPKGYELVAPPDELDVSRFEALIAFADSDPSEASCRLAEALALWRGPALADVDSELLRADRARLDELYLATLERRVAADLALGRHAEAAPELEALVRAHPLREGLRAQLMVALYRCGRQADALASYRHGRELLAEELGIDPGRELQDLELAILRQDPSLDLREAPARRAQKARDLPSGTVTLFLSDIEGSTRLWESHPGPMADALRRHDELLRQVIEDHGGYVFKTVGDSFCASFSEALSAAAAARDAQRLMAAQSWPEAFDLRVRVALHSGSCEERDGDYFGPAVNRVARLEATAHGGQVLVSRATAELLADGVPAETSLRDLGAHRLKDLGRPEHVFQLVIAGIASDFPPLRSLDSPELDNNLPAQLTSFVGRDRELAELRRLVSAYRLVTVTGAGGAGKTRLALAIAAEMLDGSGDGVWFVDLAPLNDPDLVPSTVASVLGVRDEPGRPILETLLDALATRHLLMVLDNCEHLVDACAKVADSVLHHCPRVHILATSREPLGISGERLYRVPPLGLPTEIDPSAAESVRLFVERATDQRPERVIGPNDLPVVARICKRLDGIPLAIELAAARLRSLSLSDIDTRLDGRFRLLTGGSRTALPRQQTLRALIDWSYDLLTDPERIVLERLSVFSGGFELEAAENVCSTEDLDALGVADLVGSLVDKSLVTVQSTARGVRYGLLETVRQYGLEKLERAGGDYLDELRLRHAEWFLALAEEAAPQLRGRSQLEWLDRLDAELENLRGALGSVLAENALDKAARLVAALSLFWASRHPLEGVDQLSIVISRLERHALPELRAQILWALGNAHDGADGQALLEEALEIVRDLQTPRLEAEIVLALAWNAFMRGDAVAFRELTTKAVELARLIGSKELLGRALERRAVALEDQPAEARSLFHESIALLSTHGSPNWEAAARCDQASFELYWGNFDEAASGFNVALDLTRELRDDTRVANVLANIGLLELYRQDDLAKAHRPLAEGLVLARRVGARRLIAYLLLSRAVVNSRHGHAGKAATLHGASDGLFEQLGYQPEPIESRLRENDVLELRESLEAAFHGLYRQGMTLSVDEAIELALEPSGVSTAIDSMRNASSLYFSPTSR